jgi:hypothetical protein
MSTARVVTKEKLTPKSHVGTRWALYPLLGVCFGIILTQSELVSWFVLQEMFRFQSPRMYEIIASAIVVAGGALPLIKRLGVRSLSGEPIVIPPKTMGRGIRYLAGGTICGIGALRSMSWAAVCACRQWRHRDDRRYYQRSGWHLVLWIDEAPIAALEPWHNSGSQSQGH